MNTALSILFCVALIPFAVIVGTGMALFCLAVLFVGATKLLDWAE